MPFRKSGSASSYYITNTGVPQASNVHIPFYHYSLTTIQYVITGVVDIIQSPGLIVKKTRGAIEILRRSFSQDSTTKGNYISMLIFDRKDYPAMQVDSKLVKRVPVTVTNTKIVNCEITKTAIL
jgi:hypothetical protein